MSSLNLQSLLVFAVCAQLFAPGLSELMYPYGAAENELSSYDEVTLAKSIKIFGAETNKLAVSI